MDEAATCADSNGRVIIDSGHIKTGSQLALQKRIDTYCPHMKMGMAAFASQRYADYHDYLLWEQKQAEELLVANSSFFLSLDTILNGAENLRRGLQPAMTQITCFC
jgi:hypothetical protein